MFLVAMAATLAVDVPVARICARGDLPFEARALLSLAEVFGHGMGAAGILVTVFVLDVARRRRLPRVVFCVVASGLLADLVKLVFGRTRPRAVIVDHVWSSFIGWFPQFCHSGTPDLVHGHGNLQSFPSGHAAVATALAIGLSALYPRGRWLFASFATLAVLQRVEALAHYLSDTMAGAALACLVCGICFDPRLLGGRFDRREAISLGNRCDFADKPIG